MLFLLHLCDELLLSSIELVPLLRPLQEISKVRVHNTVGFADIIMQLTPMLIVPMPRRSYTLHLRLNVCSVPHLLYCQHCHGLCPLYLLHHSWKAICSHTCSLSCFVTASTLLCCPFQLVSSSVVVPVVSSVPVAAVAVPVL